MIWIDIGTPAAAEPVTLGEAKAFLRIERNDEDELLTTLISAAREMAEAQTGLILRPGAYRLAFEAAGRRRIELTRRPVSAVTAAIGYDEDGAARPLGPGAVAIQEAALQTALLLPDGLGVSAPNGLEIEVEAGLGAEDVPEAIRLAILRLVAASYEMRALVGAGQQPAVMPPPVRGLLAPFRSLGL